MKCNKFKIIQHDLGEIGFDPVEQRRTLAWKAENNGSYYGAWVSLSDNPLDEKLRLFAASILDFVEDPEQFILLDGVTPAELS